MKDTDLTINLRAAARAAQSMGDTLRRLQAQSAVMLLRDSEWDALKLTEDQRRAAAHQRDEEMR